MKILKNIENKELVVSFEGWDYRFPTGLPVQVEDNLYAHLQKQLGLSFDFEPKLKKGDAVGKVSREKTKVHFAPAVFGAPSRPTNIPSIDQTPKSGTTDKDGVEWYGAGLENDRP